MKNRVVLYASEQLPYQGRRGKKTQIAQAFSGTTARTYRQRVTTFVATLQVRYRKKRAATERYNIVNKSCQVSIVVTRPCPHEPDREEKMSPGKDGTIAQRVQRAVIPIVREAQDYEQIWMPVVDEMPANRAWQPLILRHGVS